MKKIILVLTVLYFGFAAQAQIISQVGNGIKGIYILDLLYQPDSSELYACGYFQSLVGDPAQHIFKWKQNQWQSVGGGVTNPELFDFVAAMTWYKGQLVVAGSFNQMGGTQVKNVAGWNGQAWTAFGDSLPRTVKCFQVYNDTLYAACRNSADGTNRACLYKLSGNHWDSVTWFKMPQLSLQLAGVQCMTVYNNKLIVGGAFTAVNGVTASNIAAYDGSTWQAMSGGANDQVRAMEVYKGQLHIGGRFSAVGSPSSPADYLARWNGTNWEGMLTSLNGTVYTLETYNGYLAIGGEFGDVGLPQFLTLFDGNTHYGNLDADNVIQKLLAVGNTLYAGGDMDKVGGHTCKLIASVTYPFLSSGPDLTGNASGSIYPNPAKQCINWKGDATLQVYNTLGQLVYQQDIAQSADLSALPAGVYGATLRYRNGKEQQQKLVLNR